MIQFKAFVPFIPVILSYSQVSPIQNTHTDTHTHTHTHRHTHTIQMFFFLATPHGCILDPWPRIKPTPLQWKHGILTTEPSGSPLSITKKQSKTASGCPQDHSPVPWLLAKVYCSKRIQSRIGKGKIHGAESRGNQRDASKSSFQKESHWLRLIPPGTICDSMPEYCLPESLLETWL